MNYNRFQASGLLLEDQRRETSPTPKKSPKEKPKKKGIRAAAEARRQCALKNFHSRHQKLKGAVDGNEDEKEVCNYSFHKHNIP